MNILSGNDIVFEVHEFKIYRHPKRYILPFVIYEVYDRIDSINRHIRIIESVDVYWQLIGNIFNKYDDTFKSV
jgi:hypothetical protein